MAKSKNSIVRNVVAIGIGTAIFVALTLVQIPVVIIPNTAIQVRAAVLAFFAAVFGPIPGLAIGFLGHTLGDAIFYGSVWWSWCFPDGIFGLIVGLLYSQYRIEKGEFYIRQMFLFNLVQILANALSWIVLAPVLDILIYKEPANKVFAQGVIAAICNAVIILILGTLLGWGYSKIKVNSASGLKAE